MPRSAGTRESGRQTAIAVSDLHRSRSCDRSYNISSTDRCNRSGRNRRFPSMPLRSFPGLLLHASFLRLDVGAQHRVHAGLVATALLTKPGNDILIEPYR